MTPQGRLDAWYERLRGNPRTARLARLARAYQPVAGTPDEVVELLDIGAREWRAVHEEEVPCPT